MIDIIFKYNFNEILHISIANKVSQLSRESQSPPSFINSYFNSSHRILFFFFKIILSLLSSRGEKYKKKPVRSPLDTQISKIPKRERAAKNTLLYIRHNRSAITGGERQGNRVEQHAFCHVYRRGRNKFVPRSGKSGAEREGGGEIPSVQIKFTEKPIIVPPLLPRLTRALGESLEFISSSEGMIRFRRSDTEREGINLYVCVFIYISFSLSLSRGMTCIRRGR